MPSRLLKMRHDFPPHLENRFVNHWGFVVEKRVWKENILFKKSYISDKPINDAGVLTTIRASVGDPLGEPQTTIKPVNLNSFRDELSPYQKKALERRCDNIVNFFPDPYSAVMPIRTRLHNIAQSMMSAERKYVEDYMNENFPLPETD